jgi:hypothetical protein
MLAKGQGQQDDFAHPTKDRSGRQAEQKFKYEPHGILL